LAEPAGALEVAACALRAGGVIVCYVPTALQLKETVEALNRSVWFAEAESFETLLRNWHVKGMSVRPVHRMVAHSGFIIVARRLAAATAEVNYAPPSPSPPTSRAGDHSDDFVPGEPATDSDDPDESE